jgi:DNA/RNA-binding domain of Phe-tRNA-synthetase-like protein
VVATTPNRRCHAENWHIETYIPDRTLPRPSLPVMSDALLIENRIPDASSSRGVRVGLVRAEGVRVEVYPPGFEGALENILVAERAGQTPRSYDAEARRTAARDMLRNGRYKPTGRGKPASEYLVRAAADEFPRINALVDVNNLVSLAERLPISLWDLERAAARHFRFRLGREGEEYVFNTASQTLDLQDLVIGARVSGQADGPDEPIVSPIKDSHATKTSGNTRRVAAAVYAPVSAVTRDEMEAVCERFAAWLAGCGDVVATSMAVADPGEGVRL